MIKNKSLFILRLIEKYVKLTAKNIFEFRTNYIKVSNYNWQMIQTRNRLKEKKEAEYKVRWQEIQEKHAKIQFHYLWANRIGEFGPRIAEIEKEFGFIELASKDCGSKSAETFHVFVPSYPIANDWIVSYFAKYYETITEENIEFWEWTLRKYKNKIDFSEWDKYRIRKEVIFNEDKDKYLKFTSEEEIYCQKKMKEMGIAAGEYVCIFTRDSSYMEKHTGLKDERYHRNLDIDKLIPAIDYFEAKGLKAVRMGHTVDRGLEHRNCVDYASYHREEILDFYLIKHCKIFIGTASGILAFTGLLGCPQVVIKADWLSQGWGGMPYGSNDIFLPTKWKYQNKNCYLTFDEIFDMENKKLSVGDITYEETSEEEILEAVSEMYGILTGQKVYTKEEADLIALYRKIATENIKKYNTIETASGGGCPLKMSATFLVKNKELFGERIREIELQ